MNFPARTIIIDDEQPAREILTRLLLGYSDYFQIIGEATNGDEAFDIIESQKPDVVFLDIEMPGKDVFDMLKELNHNPYVVFCTAYDCYAIKAFDTYSIDYILKPVDEKRLSTTIEKLKKINSGADKQMVDALINNIQQLNRAKPKYTSIPHKSGDKITLVKLESVTYFQANNKYVDFYTYKNESYLTEESLTALEQGLDDDFIRISKSIILNRKYVKEIHKYFRGKYVFVLEDNEQTKLTSGGTYKDIIREEFRL